MSKKKTIIISGVVLVIILVLVIYIMAFAPFLWSDFYDDCNSIKKNAPRESIESKMMSYIQNDNRYDKVIDDEKIYIYQKGLFSHQCRIDFENGEVKKVIPVFD